LRATVALQSAHKGTGDFEDRGGMMILDVNAIQKILPHRYPFLLVDGIEEMERWKRIVGIKNVTINEYFFQGHFPGHPIMPGVLIIESMAQTGGLLLLQEVSDREKKLIYFVAIDNARFRRPVVPGDQLRVEVKVVAWRGDFCKLDGRASVNGELAAEATLMCKMVDVESQDARSQVPIGRTE
jgi:3-hydroxyacyl-[acyl-carrier-protein] dehydratase